MMWSLQLGMRQQVPHPAEHQDNQWDYSDEELFREAVRLSWEVFHYIWDFVNHVAEEVGKTYLARNFQLCLWRLYRVTPQHRPARTNVRVTMSWYY